MGKYFGVSVISTLLDWLIFYILNTYFGILYIISYIISFGTGFFTKFFLNKEFTFVYKQKDNWLFWRYCLVNIGTFVIGAVLMYLFVSTLHIQGTISRVISTFIVFVYNFIMDKIYTFKVK